METLYRDLILETVLPDTEIEIQKDGSFSLMPYILNSERVTVSYGNGDVFVGTVKYVSDRYWDYDPAYEPKEGEFRYATGEIYTGIYNNEFLNKKIFDPSLGKIIFTDGSAIEGTWLTQNNLNYWEREDIYDSSNSLTEIRDKIINASEVKEKALLNEKLKKEQAELQELAEREARRKTLIAKYGEYYGNLISQKRVVLGMNQAMVYDIWGQGAFNISTIANGEQIIQIWEFNISILARWVNIPQKLVFKNDQLTEIYR